MTFHASCTARQARIFWVLKDVPLGTGPQLEVELGASAVITSTTLVIQYLWDFPHPLPEVGATPKILNCWIVKGRDIV